MQSPFRAGEAPIFNGNFDQISVALRRNQSFVPCGSCHCVPLAHRIAAACILGRDEYKTFLYLPPPTTTLLTSMAMEFAGRGSWNQRFFSIFLSLLVHVLAVESYWLMGASEKHPQNSAASSIISSKQIIF
jgi:hypothetical protein